MSEPQKTLIEKPENTEAPTEMTAIYSKAVEPAIELKEMLDTVNKEFEEQSYFARMGKTYSSATIWLKHQRLGSKWRRSCHSTPKPFLSIKGWAKRRSKTDQSKNFLF
ncbi:MAG: hypothetical protein QW674_03970 [Candidatus Bathyarchaeia archaeon]